MNVVTYARVSTLRQERKGQSLPNQEEAFQRFLRDGEHVRVGAYQEAKSGRDMSSREEFTRMIGDLTTLKPDWIVVDTLDRLTRSLRDGLNLLEDLKGRGIRLYSIEAETAFDPDVMGDWETLVTELRAAQRERMRISTRMVKSFRARAERGGLKHNRGPFGLKKEVGGDNLVVIEEFRPVIEEVDRMYVSGSTLANILEYVRAVAPDAGWKAENGLRLALQNEAYVRAGLRTVEMQRAINARRHAGLGRYGVNTKGVHPLSGVFACGKCADLGATSLLHGNTPPAEARTYGKHGSRLVCLGSRHQRHPDNFGVQEHVLETILLDMFKRMTVDIAILEVWNTRRDAQYRGSPEHLYKKRLHSIEAEQAAVDRSRLELGLMLANLSPGIHDQVAKLLGQLAEREGALSGQRVEVLQKLAECASRPRVELNDVRLRINRIGETWQSSTSEEKAEIARGLVAAVGSRPVVYRDGRLLKIGVEWDAVFPEELRVLRYGKNVVGDVEVHRIVARRQPIRLVRAVGS